MACFLCGKEIGWLRSTVDRQYCCDEHRKEARLANANVVKEEEEEQELWSVSKSRERKRGKSGSNQASAAAFVVVGALIVLMVASPGGDGARSSSPAYSLAPSEHKGWVSRTSDYLGAVIGEQAPVSLHHDFTSGMADWTTVALSNAAKVDDPHDWKKGGNPSLVLPGTLRLWSKSTLMHNYQMEFQGEIEKRSLSWAFRATSPKDYYAAKIVITKPGPLPNAGLVHYVMLNGHEMDRVQMPLPLTLERGKEYHVRVSVQDDRFLTFLNGQVISSWKDARLSRGGVGFFSDHDDEQKVSWVNVSDRDSFLGQILAHFSLLVMPGSLPGLE